MTVCSSSGSDDSAMAKNNIITIPLQYRHHSDKIKNSSRRRNERTISDVPHRLSMPPFVAIISTLCCLFLSCTLASPSSPYYSSNYYPSYPNSLRSNYGSFYPPYSTGPGTSSFYGGKPSYAYVSPYSGGYAAGISAYEGPSYGTNTYWQPGIAVPPYGATGYGNGGIGGYGAGAGGPFPYGGGAGMGGAYGDLCRSVDCAMTASAAQCALCPQSCGVGCFGGSSAAAGLLYPPSLSPYYVSPTASLSAPNSFYSPFSPFSRSLHSAASTTTAVASERKQEKEKQQRGAKVLFNEDASSNSDEPSSAWTAAGLPSPSISGASSGSIFDQSPSRISSADGIGTSSSSLTTPNWLHPFPHQLQQHSKVIRMDDLVMDKAKHSKKMTTS